MMTRLRTPWFEQHTQHPPPYSRAHSLSHTYTHTHTHTQGTKFDAQLTLDKASHAMVRMSSTDLVADVQGHMALQSMARLAAEVSLSPPSNVIPISPHTSLTPPDNPNPPPTLRHRQHTAPAFAPTIALAYTRSRNYAPPILQLPPHSPCMYANMRVHSQMYAYTHTHNSFGKNVCCMCTYVYMFICVYI